jgi:hypothetical protein
MVWCGMVWYGMVWYGMVTMAFGMTIVGDTYGTSPNSCDERSQESESFGAGDIEMLILLIRKLGMKVVFGMTMIMQMF